MVYHASQRYFNEEDHAMYRDLPSYSGDRGLPERYAHWVMLGYAVFAVDVRGQGGETGNLLSMDSGVVKGWVTQGITDMHRSYYMAIAMDAVRAVETASQQRCGLG